MIRTPPYLRPLRHPGWSALVLAVVGMGILVGSEWPPDRWSAVPVGIGMLWSMFYLVGLALAWLMREDLD